MKPKTSPHLQFISRFIGPIALIGPAAVQAADIDTTGGATITAPFNIGANDAVTNIIGAGTLTFNGGGTIGLGNNGPNHIVNMNMTGGLIDVQTGVNLQNGGWQDGVWTNNFASIAVASGATLDVWDGNQVRVDALTGAGTVTISPGFGVNWAGGRSFVLGVNGGSGTFTGNINGNSASDGGSLSLTKAGAGTQTLTGTNTYNGSTTISGGILQIGNGGTSGSLSNNTNVTNNAGLVFNRSDASSYSGNISGSGTVTKEGAGTLTLSGGNTYSGGTTINGGTLRLGGSYATAGLVGRWTFDGANADDSSGNNYNGTAVGSPTYSSADTQGGAGNALVLNGTSAIRVDTGGSQTVFDGGTAMTVSAWVQGVPGTWNPFVGKNGEPNGWQLRRHANNNTLDWTTRGLSSSDYESNATNALDGGWHMVTMTYDGSTKSIYVDGILNASTGATGTIAASGSQLMFGGRDNGGFGNFLTGKLDDIYFYNRSITATEVTALYGSVLPSTTPVMIASGAALDLNGKSQKIASLTGDIGATVTNGGSADSGLTISGAATTTFNGIISDGATNKISLVKSGSGTQILTGANTYTGSTTISGGILQIGDGGATGSLSTTSVIANNGNLTINRNNAVAQGTDFNGAVLAGSGSFTQAGSGTTTLTSASYSGGTTVNGGRLVLSNTTTGSSNFTTNAELEFNVTTGTRQLNGGTIAGTGNLIKTGPDQLWFGANGSPQTVALTGANSIIDVQGGVLRNEYGNSAWGGNQAGLNVASGAFFDLWDGNTTVDELTGSGTINKGWSDSNTLTIGANNGSGTFSGVIENNRTDFFYGGNGGGNLSLVKTGTGKQTLSGTSTYAGPTVIVEGELNVNGNIASSSLLTIESGGILSGSGTVGAVNALDGSQISPGNSPGILHTGSVTTSSMATLTIQIGGLNAGTDYDQVDTSGSLTLNGGVLDVQMFNGYVPAFGSTFTIWNNNDGDSVMGTFNSLPEGTYFPQAGTPGGFAISYAGNTGNDVVLTYIPEPTVGLLTFASLWQMLLRRRR